MKTNLCPRPEHPNPQWERKSFVNLNGKWMFEVDNSKTGEKRGLITADTLSGEAEAQTVEYIYGADEKCGSITFEKPQHQLTVGTLQSFIDAYIKEHEGVEVDYIHGEASVKALSRKDGAIGFMFGGMEKNQLFKTVIFDGALPRKTFSMGHATDKRYYLECRQIDLDEVNR